jgi:20S proteasome subunit alpha 6
MDKFPGCDVDQLVRHALRALRDCLPNETELTAKNVSLAVVSTDTAFTLYENDTVAPYLAAIDEEADGAAALDELPDAPAGGLDAAATSVADAAPAAEGAMEVAPE